MTKADVKLMKEAAKWADWDCAVRMLCAARERVRGRAPWRGPGSALAALAEVRSGHRDADALAAMLLIEATNGGHETQAAAVQSFDEAAARAAKMATRKGIQTPAAMASNKVLEIAYS